MKQKAAQCAAFLLEPAPAGDELIAGRLYREFVRA
jgi:hypothetical protein